MKTTIAAVSEDLANPVLTGISLFLAFLKTFVLTYVFSDFKFASFMLVLVALDSILGISFAIYEKDFDPKAFGQFLIKCVLYMALLSVGHVMTHLSIDGELVTEFAFAKRYIYIFMAGREIASILKFGGKRWPGFAKQILKYFRGFDSQGLPENNK